MNAVIYARYSSERQTEQSIEGQLRECRAYAEKNDLQIIHEYIDRAKTGTNDEREDFQQMLRDSKKGAFEAVIVWKVDRFGRNREDIAKNKAILRRNGVQLLYAREHIPEGSEGIIIESLMEGLAEYYSAELAEKIERGMRESAYKGKFNGSGCPYGFTADKDHNFHVDEQAAETVRKIFTMYASGSTLQEIINALNATGFRTKRGNKADHNFINRTLVNRRYLGEYRWKDIIIPGAMPRIIDDELFDAVQKRLKEGRKVLSRTRKDKPKYMLTGKVFCGCCGQPMTGDSGTGKGGESHYYYSCRNRRSGDCTVKSVKKEWLENKVIEMTAQIVADDAVVSDIADKSFALYLQTENENAAIDALEARKMQVEKKLANILSAIEEGIFNSTTKTRMEELETEKTELELQIAEAKRKRVRIKRDDLYNFIVSFRDGDYTDEAFCQQMIDTFVNKVIVYGDHIEITWNATKYTKCSGKFPSPPPNANLTEHITVLPLLFAIKISRA